MLHNFQTRKLIWALVISILTICLAVTAFAAPSAVEMVDYAKEETAEESQQNATLSSDIWDGTSASGFDSGSGTENDPFIIKTPEQLAFLAYSVNSGTSYSGKYIKLANDIYLNDTTNWQNWGTTAPANSWTAIGTSYSNSFRGTFDGQGNEISGIYINTSSDYQGLFGYVYNGGTVKNVGVTSSYIKNSGAVGGVVARNNGTVSNCYNTGDVTGTGSYVGGFVGCNYGTVTGCYNTGDVTGSSYYVGGVVGYNESTTIENCHNTGTVMGNNNVGGIVGYDICGHVKNCYNTGDVTGTGSDVGGVVGSSSMTPDIINCFNTGTVMGDECVGGIVGYAHFAVTTVGVKKSYNTGNISGSSKVGGVIGRISTDIPDSQSAVISCYNSGDISGNTEVGGIIGYNKYNTVISVSNSYYLSGCAKDGNDKVQYGIGNSTQGSATADVSGQTTGLSDEQMKLKDSFKGFDFDTVWAISSADNGGYPYLITLGYIGSTNTPKTLLDVHAIRTVSPTGLRFKAKISTAHTATEIGWIVTTEEKLTAASISKDDFTKTSNVTKVEGINYSEATGTDKVFSTDGETDIFAAVLTGITSKDYQTVLVARPYAIDEDGTWYGEPYSMCIKDVAEVMKNSSEFTSFTQEQQNVINAILNGQEI